MVETVDFFTPVVDDPYWFGRIAAANAFSDVWAMGARPLFALNLVGLAGQDAPAWSCSARCCAAAPRRRRWPARPSSAATPSTTPSPSTAWRSPALVHPDRILRNVGARPGDRLLLTKPLGSGIVTTAIKRGLAPPGADRRAVRGSCPR